MYLKLKLRDGVPVGNNFEDYLANMNAGVFAALEFSFSGIGTMLVQGAGGCLETKPVILKTINGFYVPSGATGSQDGVLFIKNTENSSFDKFDFPYVSGLSDLNVYSWDVLATDYQVTVQDNLTTYSENLPYRPLGTDPFGNPIYGFHSVTYNGIPQDFGSNYTTVFNAATDALQQIKFYTFQFGAEYPNPVLGGVHQSNIYNGFTRSEFELLGNSNAEVDLTFDFTNFDIESPIVPIKSTDPVTGSNYYAVIERDISGEELVAEGMYKIMDKSKGIIRVKLSTDLIKSVSADPTQWANTQFVIIIPEQLLEEIGDTVVRYKSSYGKVYNGYNGTTELLIANFVGNSTTLSAPIKSNSPIGEKTDVLYKSNANTAGNQVILAVDYVGVASVFADSQQETYYPDTIRLYFSSGIAAATIAKFGTTDADLRSYVDINQASWYNWDVQDIEYNPVERVERGVHTLVMQQELAALGLDPVQDSVDPRVPITRFRFGLPAFTYVYAGDVSLGTLDEVVRRDAQIPEPHHINAPMVKEYVKSTVNLYIPANEQQVVYRHLKIDGHYKIDGRLLVL